MRALVQRVRNASVTVDGRVVAAIGRGMVVLVGVTEGDADADRDWLARKLVNLRIFDDAAGAMNESIIDTGGEILAVSQFTLYASTRKGNRPSWSAAAPPEVAKPIFDAFGSGPTISTGEVHNHLGNGYNINVGPVTIALDSRTRE